MHKMLIVDDHSVVRTGLKFIVKQNLQNIEVFEASDGNEAIELYKKNEFDLIILDIFIPETNVINLINYFLTKNPAQNILIFTMNSEELYGKRFLKMGAKGYLSKESPDEEIVRAIWIVLKGARYISNNLAQLLSIEALDNKKENPFEALSNREFEVTMCLIKGDSMMQIADTLNLHSSTVATHKAHVFEKVGVQNILQLAEMARLYGLTSGFGMK